MILERKSIEFVRLYDCCILEKGTSPIQKTQPGPYPLVVTTSERKTAVDYQFDKPSVCIPLISSRGHGVASLNEVFYQEGKFALGNILCCVTPDENTLLAKYLYYYLNYKKDQLLVPLMKGGANVSLTVDSLKRVKVPKPTIEIQKEIVLILDTFVEYMNELALELTARKKQFAYFRDKLVLFDDCYLKQTDMMNIQSYLLSEIADIVGRIGFRGYTSNDYRNEGDGVIAVNPGNIINNHLDLSNSNYISWEKYYQSPEIMLKKTDIVFVKTGFSIGKVAIYDSDEQATINPQLVIIKNCKINSTFLKYLMETSYFQNEVTKRRSLTTTPNISQSELGKIKLNVPSLEYQSWAVKILDSFEKLIFDSSTSISTEIRLRQDQYKYYCDKLLSFTDVPQ